MKPDYDECQRRCRELAKVIGLNYDSVYRFFLQDGNLCSEYEEWGGNHSWTASNQIRKATSLDVAILDEIDRLKEEFQALNSAHLALVASAKKKLNGAEKEALGLT